MRSPIETKNHLLSRNSPLTSKDKDLFAYFGVNAKIKPPYRILNPHRIHIGDTTSIQEYCHINAFEDLSFLRSYIAAPYLEAFPLAEYLYDSKIAIGNESQIGRFLFVSCTKSITLDDNEVEFSSKLGPFEVKRKFKLKEMTIAGKLEL